MDHDRLPVLPLWVAPQAGRTECDGLPDPEMRYIGHYPDRYFDLHFRPAASGLPVTSSRHSRAESITARRHAVESAAWLRRVRVRPVLALCRRRAARQLRLLVQAEPERQLAVRRALDAER